MRLALRPLSKIHHGHARFHPLKQPFRRFYSSSYLTLSTKSSSSASKEQDVNDPRYFKFIPSDLHPYAKLARIDKPIGTWLLYLPCTWSISMASYHSSLSLSSTASMLALFGLGAFVMRGAGCTINDLCDRDFDKKVERTKERPIASGAVSVRNAVLFLGAQLSAGLMILTQFNLYSILLGASSMALVSTYPLAKRFTNYPQFILGLTFNWGALLGWPAMLGTSNWEVTLPLYSAGLLWTLVYDTIYAHQDKRDDEKIGIKSTARTFDSKTKPVLTTFNLVSTCLWMLAGQMNDHTMVYHLFALLAGLNMQRLILYTNLESPASCNRAFKASKNSGLLVLMGIMSDILIQLHL